MYMWCFVGNIIKDDAIILIFPLIEFSVEGRGWLCTGYCQKQLKTFFCWLLLMHLWPQELLAFSMAMHSCSNIILNMVFIRSKFHLDALMDVTLSARYDILISYIQGLFFFRDCNIGFFFIAWSSYIRFLARRTKLYSVLFPLRQKACVRLFFS